MVKTHCDCGWKGYFDNAELKIEQKGAMKVYSYVHSCPRCKKTIKNKNP